MTLNRSLSTFDRAAAADDAIICSHSSTSLPESVSKRGSTRAFLLAAFVLLCVATTFAQRHRGGSSTDELSALSCGTGSLTGAASDTCTVTLAEAATSGGFAVTLASSSSAVIVPSSVTVASGATTAQFKATAAAVTSAQTATLTASDRRNSETYSLQLKPTTTSTGTAALTLGSSSVAFGDVTVNTPSTQTVTLTSSGTASLTISAAAIKGTGFTMSGLAAPVTLAAGQTATLNVQFDPTAAGADTGSVTLTTNATAGTTSTVSLTGTGEAAAGYHVSLSWDAPSSSSPAVAGYHIYRAVGTSGSYQLLNSDTAATDYSDTSVTSGTTYNYEVMSVDSSGTESKPSNVYTTSIP
jgi:hypothetical protein